MAIEVKAADRSHVPEMVGLWKGLMEHHTAIDPYFEMGDAGPKPVTVGELTKGRKVVIFREGRLAVTGALMKVYEGPGAIAQPDA